MGPHWPGAQLALTCVGVPTSAPMAREMLSDWTRPRGRHGGLKRPLPAGSGVSFLDSVCESVVFPGSARTITRQKGCRGIGRGSAKS